MIVTFQQLKVFIKSVLKKIISRKNFCKARKVITFLSWAVGSCDINRLYSFSFFHPMEAPYEFNWPSIPWRPHMNSIGLAVSKENSKEI